MFDLSGRVAVVTGAGQGSGTAIARGLAQAGATLGLCDLKADGVSDLAAELPQPGYAAQCDVTDAAAVAGFARDVSDRLGQVSILVNNAGVIARSTPDADDYAENWDRIFAVNLTGARLMTEAFLPQLKATKGSIINIGSIMSVTAGPGLTAYAASKGALAQYTRALAHDLAPLDVRVNALLPGVIETPMTAVTRDNPNAIGRFLAHTPMGRVGQPTELAGPVVFLASGAASYVTGALLPVDGGYLAA
ncbi:SDR family NAD(P)-dependent oxidoreductase [Halovulum sp. GXIMD14793]